MPDPPIQTTTPYELTPAQVEIVSNALHRKGVADHCLRCNTARWTVELAHVVVTPVSPLSGFPFQWGSFPSIVLTCENCGWTVFHSVHTLGIAEELGLSS